MTRMYEPFFMVLTYHIGTVNTTETGASGRTRTDVTSLEGWSPAIGRRKRSGAETWDRTRMSPPSTAREDYLCYLGRIWRQGTDSNGRHRGYGPRALPGCATLRQIWSLWEESHLRPRRYERRALLLSYTGMEPAPVVETGSSGWRPVTLSR